MNKKINRKKMRMKIKKKLVFYSIVGLTGIVCLALGMTVFIGLRNLIVLRVHRDILSTDKRQHRQSKELRKIYQDKEVRAAHLGGVKKSRNSAKREKARRVGAFTNLIGIVQEAKLIAQSTQEIAELGREPSIVEGLVIIEKARLEGFDLIAASRKEGVLYEGPDFKVTEKIEEKGGLKIRTLALENNLGDILVEQKMIADEIIIGLSSFESARALSKGTGLEIAEVPPQGVGAYKFKIKDPRRVEEALASVILEGNEIIQEQSLEESTGRIQFAEPNGIVRMNGGIAGLPNDPEFGNQWGLHNIGQNLPVEDERFDVPKGTEDVDIDAPEAWDISKGEKNIIIAIVDTGCDYNHPDLYNNIWKNPDEIPANDYDDDGNGYIDDVYGWNFSSDSNDIMDDHNHGTYVAGIIGASGENAEGIAGVMPKTNLMVIKVLNEEGNGTWYDAAQGIRYAVNKGAKVINISWSGPEESQVIKDAFEEALQKDVLIICSSGSQGKDIDTEPEYPAAFPMENIITVCAIDATDRLAAFSNTGLLSVDLGAPGVQILSTNGAWEEQDEEDYVWGLGTSASAGHVTGAVGLLRSLVPGASAQEVKQIILETVFPTTALSGKCVTGGRLNLYDAVNKMIEGTAVYIETTEIDGDGIISPAEVVNLSITLKNIGQDHAYGIVGSLSLDKGKIIIADPTKNYGDIPSGISVTRTYRLHIDSAFVTPDLVTFTLDIEDREQNESRRRFYYPVYTLSSLSGRVLDYLSRNPLENATVSLEVTFDYEPPYFTTLTTDALGAYALDNLKDGTYRLKASYAGMVDSDWAQINLPPSVDNLNFLMGTGAQIEYEPSGFDVNVAAGMKLDKSLFLKNVGAPDLRYYISSRKEGALAEDKEYEIVKKIPAPPEGTLSGMCWDGKYLWVAKNSVTIKFFRSLDAANTIYKIDPKDGTILKKIFLADSTSLGGLAWVEGKLWYVDRSGGKGKCTLNRIDPNYTESESREPGSQSTQSQSLISRIKAVLSGLLGRQELIIKASPIEKKITLTYASDAWGLTWDGEKFWVMDQGYDRIWHIDPNGSGTPPYILNKWADQDYSYDLAWDGKYLWSTNYKPGGGAKNIFNCDPSTGGDPARDYEVKGPDERHLAITYDGMMVWVSGVDKGRWLYQLDLAKVSWLTTEPFKGQILPDDTHNVKVTFDASSFTPSMEPRAFLKILTNDEDNRVVSIPVTMHVEGGPGLKYQLYVIDDDRRGASRGDSDTYPEAGETVEMKITLINEGSYEADAEDVAAVLSTDDTQYIEIKDDFEEFGDISGNGGTGTSQNAYVFSIAGDTPQGYQVKFTLDIQDGAGRSWLSDIFVIIKNTSYVSGRVTDAKTGAPIEGAKIVAQGELTREGFSREDGTYTVFGLYDGTHSLQVLDDRFFPSAPQRVNVPPVATGINFALRRPIIGINPDTLSADVPKDGRVNQFFNISNTGSTDLIFRMAAMPVGGSSSSAAGTSFDLSAGTFQTLTNGQLVAKMLAARDGKRKGLDSQLADKMAANPDDKFNVIVKMQAGFPQDLAQIIDTASSKEKILRALIEHSEAAQKDLKRRLKQAQDRYPKMTRRFFKFTNTVAIRGATKELVEEIASRTDVQEVYETESIQMELPPDTEAQPPVGNLEWNIDRVKADKAWEMGVDGRGILIGSIDTGVEADHPDLLGKWREENGWFDPVYGEESPKDVYGHGTHTIGTMVGGDADGTHIGIAPAATFISANGFSYSGSGSWDDLIDCGEWMMDPDKNPGTDDAPVVICNSWGTSQGSYEGYRDTVIAWVAVGIFPEFSNGNSGPGSGTVGAPASYPESFGTGATTPSDEIASFSSRGPSPIEGVIKPDISAPGTEIKSSFPGKTYREWQGTSMAGPHVAATVALMVQAGGRLSVDELRTKLEAAAKDLGEPGKDNTYGAGLLNTFEAVKKSGVAWLRLEPREGTVSPNESADIKVTYDAKGLEKQTYEAKLIVINNDPVNSDLEVPVTMNVVSGASIVYDSHSIHDTNDDTSGDGDFSSGDSDNYPEKGETVEMKVILKNIGTDDANTTGVKAWLSTTDPYITQIPDDYEDYGDMLSGSQATSGYEYNFIISPSTPQEHVVTFTLDIRDGQGGVWTDFLNVVIRDAYTIEGNVADAKTFEGIEGATITAIGPVEAQATTDENGDYLLSGLFDGLYTLFAFSPDYFAPQEQFVRVPPSQSGLDFEMARPEANISPDLLQADVPEGGKEFRKVIVGNDGSVDLEFAFAELVEGSSFSAEYLSQFSSRGLSNKELVRQRMEMRKQIRGEGRIGISQPLRKKIDEAPQDEMIRAIIEFTDIVDMEKYVGNTSALIKAMKRKYVSQQKNARKLLEELKAKGVIEDFHAFWISNTMSIKAPKKIIEQLGELEEIFEIRPDGVLQLPEPVEVDSVGTQDSYEWNVSKVRAPEVWAVGIDGTGVLVGSIDTGVEADHPDLLGKMRPENSWFDPVYGGESPYDDYGHGTHTMGTTLGGNNSGKWIGLAPGATFIMAKAFDAGGRGSWSNIHKCMEWILDPDGNPDTNDYPLVVNNSWGSSNGADREVWDDVTAWVAAGIFPAFANGNSGPGSGSVGSPASYPHSFGIGATNSSDNIASFSSRGPSPIDGGIKPDVSAPGVAINSSFPGKSYKVWQGTSMATPHITGVVALMKQANPAMSIDDIGKAIEETAVDLGEEGKDNTFGAGRLDCYEAFKKAGVIWLHQTPQKGTVAPESQAEILITFDASEQIQGTYTVDLVAFTNDPVNPSKTIPVTMTVITGPSILYQDHSLDDSRGDNDGFVEPDETITMDISLLNAGRVDADTTGVVATLTTEDDFTTINDDYGDFGEMLSGSIKTADYEFYVDSGAPDGHAIKFNLHITDARGNSWDREFKQLIKYASKISGKVTDAKTGDPVQSALVKAIGPVDKEAITDVSGDYELSGLFSGEYEVSVEKSDYHLPAPRVVVVPPDTTGIDFTLDRPVAAVEPTSLSVSLPPEAGANRYFTISNQGTIDLEYALNEVNKAQRGSSSSALTNGQLYEQMQALKDTSRRGLSSELAEKMEDNPDDRFNVLIVLDEELPEGIAEMADRGDKEGIIRALRDKADKSQKGIMAKLGNIQANNRDLKIKRFWSTNVVCARGLRAEEVRQISERPDVREVYEEGIVQIPQPPRTGAQPPVGDLEWNIHRVKADKAWDMGVDGTGVLIGSLDTGVEPTHPDLAGKMRPEHSWFDSVNGRGSPYDDHGHGTHTIGTMVGGDADGTHIGVAPGAQYISAKGFNSGGSGQWGDLIECGEWLMDPDGDPATDDAPVVICNSWGGSQTDRTYWDTVAAWVALGIFSEFSIGNSGPSQGSANAPGNYPHSFGTGATTPSDAIASFSSRGPSYFEGVIKPDISAPGTEIKSSFPGDGYKEWQGTSMAGPHVAAAVALMKQINPTLSIDETREKLEASARDLGDEGKDNTFGAGLLDCYEAVLLCDVPWLDKYPEEGIIAPSESKQILVSFDSEGQELGDYFADIIVASNDPVNAQLRVAIEMAVVDSPTDVTPPWGSIAIEKGAEYHNSSDVLLALTAQDDTSPPAEIMARYSIDGGSSYTEWDPFPLTRTRAVTLIPGEGERAAHVQFKDAGENVSITYVDNIIIDTAPPQGTVFVERGVEYTTKTQLLLELSANDSLSGVELMAFSEDGSSFTPWQEYGEVAVFTVSSDGQKTIYVKFKDRAGNIVIATDDIIVDTTGPVITITNPEDGSIIGTHTPRLTYTIVDEFDPTALTYYVMVDSTVVPKRSGDQLDSLRDGPHTIEVASKDRLGNIGRQVSDFTVYTGDDDITPPTGSILIENDAQYTSTTSVTLNLTASDNQYPPASLQVAFSDNGIAFGDWEAFSSTKAYTLSDSDGEKAVYVKFKDSEDNVSDAYSDSILLDTTAPTIHVISLTSGDTVNVSPCLIQGYVTDNFSESISSVEVGAKAYPVLEEGKFSANATLNPGENTITLIASDEAGNQIEEQLTLTLDARLEQYSVYEIALVPTALYANPFQEVNLSCDFRGAVQKGFYDGDNIFRVRFTPTQAGSYTFTTTSNDPDLNEVSGNFQAVASDRRGFLRVSGRQFSFDNDENFLPFSDTTLNILNAQESKRYEIIRHDHDLGMNTLRILLFNADESVSYRNWVYGGTKEDPDYERFNVELFKELEYIISYLDEEDMIAEVILLSSNTSDIDNEALKDYLRYAMARLSSLTNITLTIAIDYKDGFTDSEVSEFAQVIEVADSINNHILTVASDEIFNFSGATWADVITLRTGQDPTQPIESHYPNNNNKPILTYLATEDSSLAQDTRDNGFASTDLVRSDSIRSFLKGGFGSYSDTHSSRDNELIGRIADEHLANFVAYLLSFKDHTLLEPTSSLADSGYCLRKDDKKEYLVYLPESTSVEVDMTESIKYFTVEWFRPQDNNIRDGGEVGAGAERSFNSPLGADVLLRLVKIPNKKPTAFASANRIEGFAPLDVQFTGSGSDLDGEIVEYRWDFGDGDTSTEQNPLHTYEEVGTFAASLIVVDDENALSEPATVDITTWLDEVPPDITIESSTPADDGTVSSTPINLTIRGKVTDNAEVDTLTIAGRDTPFGSDGSFTFNGGIDLFEFENVIDIIATDRAGNSSAESLTIHLYTLSLEANPTSGLVPLEVEFETTTSTSPQRTIILYEWDFEGDRRFEERSNDDNTATHLYTAEGNYPATIRVRDSNGKVNSATVLIQAQFDPAHSPTIDSLRANPTSGTAPLVITFKAQVSDPDGYIVKYEWDFNGDGVYDSSSDTSAQVTTTYTLSGTYIAVLKVTDDDGLTITRNTLEDSFVIDVASNPQAPEVSLEASPLNGPVPLSVNFTAAVSSGGPILRYEWDFNTDGVCDLVTPQPQTTHTYRNLGKFKASVAVIDDRSLKATSSKVITVNNDTPPSWKPDNPTKKIRGDVPLLVDFEELLGVVPGVVLYRFDFDGDGNFDLDSETIEVTHTYRDVGTYKARVLMRGSDDWEKSYIVRVIARRAPIVYIRVPKDGWTISGTHVTVVATLSPRLIPNTETLEFQYREVGVQDWLPLSEPLTERPYVIHWDTTTLANGDYELRALVTKTGIPPEEVSSEIIKVSIDNLGSGQDVEETEVDGEHIKQQKLKVKQAVKVILADNSEVNFISSDLVISSDTLTLQTLLSGNVSPALSDPRDGSVRGLGVYRGISLAAGDTTFTQDMEVTIPYEGLGDIIEPTLAIYTYNETTEEWEKAFDSQVYGVDKVVKARINHLSHFGLGGSSQPPSGGGGGDGGGSSSGGGGCFIATAAYGTPLSEEIKVLSKFRDEYLLTNNIGKELVKFYYHNSPPIADYIRTKPKLKAAVRTLLKPVVWLVEKIVE